MGQSIQSCSLCEKQSDDIPPEKEVEDRIAMVREIVQTDSGEVPKVGVAKNYRRLSTSGPALSETQIQQLQPGLQRSPTTESNKDRIISCSSSQSSLHKSGLEKVFNNDDIGDRRAVLISSVTEASANKRSSFKEKNEEVICPPGREKDEGALLCWMQELGIGWACKKGLKVNSPNQDSFSILAVEGEFILVGVYDGHGPHGHDVSQFVRQEMVKLILKNPNRADDIESVLIDCFKQVQQGTAKASGVDAWESGTTCTMVYLDLVKQQAVFAHVGDARSVIGHRKNGQDFISEDMTVDHKPNLPEEKKRIESANPPGRVLFDGFVNYRVFVQNGMYPGLNMSRALGDVWAHRDAGLSAVPDIRTVDLKPLLKNSDEVELLVCSDGVWEFLEGKDAFKLTSHMSDPDTIVNRLALRSWELWMEDSNNEICDDITAVCVQLHKVKKSTDRHNS